jgi:methyl-accepting chemotaxis protein
MNWLLNRLRLGAKLWLAPGFTLFILLCFALGGYLAVSQQQTTLQQLVEVRTPALFAVVSLERQVKEINTLTYQLLSWNTAGYSANQTGKLSKSISQSLPAAKTAAQELPTKPGLSATEVEAANRIADSITKYVKLIPPVLDMADVDQSVSTTMMIKTAGPFNDLNKEIEAMRNAHSEALTIASAESARYTSWMIAWGVTALVVCVLLAIFLIWAVRRSILNSISTISAAAERLKEGDLSPHTEVSGNDEVANTARAMADSVTVLRDTIRVVNVAVQELNTAISEIAMGNQDLSERTERQASHLQQTSSEMDHLTSAVQANANSAQDAATLALRVAERTARGGDMVNQVVTMMRDITDSSRKVHDIISVINGIAFQTNILALNAAVEAARAGENGRGFAVVAGEVRTLSQRSAQAAAEIQHLISDSVKLVESGGSLVANTGDAMHDVVSDVQALTGLIREISQASENQSRGVLAIASTLAELEANTQQNAGLVEEAAAAAASMRHESSRLMDASMRFKLDTFV